MSTSGKEPVRGHPQTDEESSRSYFNIKIEDLTGLIEAYQKRTFVEDIDYLQKNLGGVE